MKNEIHTKKIKDLKEKLKILLSFKCKNNTDTYPEHKMGAHDQLMGPYCLNCGYKPMKPITG